MSKHRHSWRDLSGVSDERLAAIALTLVFIIFGQRGLDAVEAAIVARYSIKLKSATDGRSAEPGVVA